MAAAKWIIDSVCNTSIKITCWERGGTIIEADLPFLRLKLSNESYLLLSFKIWSTHSFLISNYSCWGRISELERNIKRAY